jgi:xylulokinase
LTHHWFQATFASAEGDAAGKLGKTVYDFLDEKAGNVRPGSDKLFFVPHLAGRAGPLNTNHKGIWLGFTWDPPAGTFLSSPARVYRL